MASWIWVLIPLAAIFTGVIKRWLDIKEKHMDAANREALDQAARYAAQTDRLEQRVRVLERIVTDKSLDVSDEIARLRDDRLV